MFNCDSLNKLIAVCQSKEDTLALELICESLESFEDYHRTIYAMETKLKIFNSNVMEREEYCDMVESLDKNRTMYHNNVVTSVNLLNRMAEREGLPLVYEGVVSKERPYRREVANAVLDYVETVIKTRR